MREGCEQPASPTTRAGTPATVVRGGTSFNTTLPAAMRSAITNSDVAENFRASPDHHAAPNLGMAVARFLAAAAQRDIMEERSVVADLRRLADHDAGAVVEHDPAADLRRRVDIHAEHSGGLALQVHGEVFPAELPQRVRKALGLKRVEALEVEERIDQAVAGGIAVVDRR